MGRRRAVKAAEPWRKAWRTLAKSTCRVRMGAVVTDAAGAVVGTGWNHADPGTRGLHAEAHALARTPRGSGRTIYVRGWDGKNETPSAPCPDCRALIARAGIRLAVVRGADRERRGIRVGGEGIPGGVAA